MEGWACPVALGSKTALIMVLLDLDHFQKAVLPNVDTGSGRTYKTNLKMRLALHVDKSFSEEGFDFIRSFVEEITKADLNRNN